MKGLKERDLLPLDDEFAKSVGDAETLDELRNTLRQDVHQSRTAEARRAALAQIIAAMAEGAAIELPEPMIDRAVEDDVRRLRGRLAQQGIPLEAYLRMTEQSEDELREELRPTASFRLRNSLLLRSIAEKEGISIDDETVDSAVDRLATAAQDATQPGQAEAFVRSDVMRELLESELFEQQLMDRLIDIATEGRGAVLNPWTPPVEPEGEATPAGTAPVAETSAEEVAASEA